MLYYVYLFLTNPCSVILNSAVIATLVIDFIRPILRPKGLKLPVGNYYHVIMFTLFRYVSPRPPRRYGDYSVHTFGNNIVSFFFFFCILFLVVAVKRLNRRVLDAITIPFHFHVSSCYIVYIKTHCNDQTTEITQD